MRVPLIAGNWKLYKSCSEACALVSDLVGRLGTVADLEVVIAPTFTALSSVHAALSGSSLKLAAQDCFWENEGAYTGEISAAMLTDVGCSHVIIGHSERRLHFGETDDTVSRKAASALTAGLTTIVCVGETLDERQAGTTFQVLRQQLEGGLCRIPHDFVLGLVIAYEPIWAIGTGKTATTVQAQEAHAYIRGVLAGLFGADTASGLRIIYGGSVKPDNIRGLMAEADIDGALVGGASLSADSFTAIVRYRE